MSICAPRCLKRDAVARRDGYVLSRTAHTVAALMRGDGPILRGRRRGVLRAHLQVRGRLRAGRVFGPPWCGRQPCHFWSS